ncbi:thiolase family protein [Amycolatopsis pithecellobii]|uniref:Probable acetyl-CoA acetyltransferase n=1 Tax=Amycolatopsis pithecellobii TaxID=664692 RepID=A0A6N7YRZ7_9PSEU|nr:thiolase family protein [Amycolatopsis pithecellobii]MTD54708.1 acetyl-CoA C-acyltransferase [Amycolatopsis pithecellobii]
MDDNAVWLVDGVRTPFGRFGGGLSEVPVVDLAAHVLKAALARSEWPIEALDELNVGMAMLEGGLMVPARQYAVAAGLPQELPTLTVDRACCSGMTTVGLGARAIATGARSVLAAGVESMSRTPRLLHGSRASKRGDLQVEDILMLRSPLTGGEPIAKSAGIEAVNRGVGREAQDEWALASHEKYFAALESGYFDDEIVEVETPTGVVAADEQPRRGGTLEKLARLTPVYGSPTVTAGNAPGLNDGAVALILAGTPAVEKNNVAPLARVRGHFQTAAGPTSSVYLPGLAIRALLDRHGVSLDDVSVIEINEAYAATALVSVKTLADGDDGLETKLRARTNIAGGAVAIGHPTGASGARLVLTAARHLRERGGRYAVAAICGGFGQTDAVLIEAAH